MRSDLWSLGVVLFELLSATWRFRDGAPHLAARHPLATRRPPRDDGVVGENVLLGSGTPRAKRGVCEAGRVPAAAALPASRSAPRAYARHRPETTTLYEVVRDNLETLYGAIDDGALAVRVPKHAKKELDAYLSCGVLCPRLRAAPLRLLRGQPARGVLVQGPWLLPLLHRQADVCDGREHD